MKRAFLYIIFVFLPVFHANCQDVPNPVSAGFKVHSGLNLPFYKAVDYLVEEGIYSFDIFLQQQSVGKHFQDELWNYPRTGAGYSVWSLGNDDVFGKAHVLYAQIQVPFKNSFRKVRLGTMASVGAAYLPKSFDVKHNHLNRAIGSHLNIYMSIAAYCNINLTNNFEFVLDAGLTHFSNGKTRSPNYGINAATLAAGLNYSFAPDITYATSAEKPPVPGKYFHSVTITGGRKVYDYLTGEKYISTTISYGLERYLTHSGKAGFGADLFYDGSIIAGMAEEGNNNSEFADQLRFGVHGSYALQYRKTQAGLQLGYYLYSKYRVLTNLYTRIFLSYFLTENVNAVLSIRSHYGKADSFEYGIGYTW